MKLRLWPLLCLFLVGCVSPPNDEANSVSKTPVVSGKPTNPSMKSPGSTKSLPMSPSVILPTDWSVIDPKRILAKVEYKPEAGGVLFTLKKQSGLELFSAEDAEHRSYYKGRLNDAHVVALPSQHTSVLIVFTNHQNARTSVLLKYR